MAFYHIHLIFQRFSFSCTMSDRLMLLIFKPLAVKPQTLVQTGHKLHLELELQNIVQTSRLERYLQQPGCTLNCIDKEKKYLLC